MSQQLGRNNNQQKPRSTALDQPKFYARKMVTVFFLVFAALLVFAGNGLAASGETNQVKQPHKALVPGAYRVADATNSFENWQADRFFAIDSQKRLDALARKSRQKVKQRRTVIRNRSSVRKSSGILIKLRKSAKRKARKIRPPKVAKRKPRKQRSLHKRRANQKKNITPAIKKVALVTLVRKPEKIQRCLKKAGYFTGVITGRLDDATLLAFLSFREDKNLRHRPMDLYDSVSQKRLFELCSNDSLNPLHQIVASAKGKKPIFVTSLQSGSKAKSSGAKSAPKKLPPMKSIGKKGSEGKSSSMDAKDGGPVTTASISTKKKDKKQSRLPEFAVTIIKTENGFAQDVLIATDHSKDLKETDGKAHASSNQKLAQVTGSSSSFAMKQSSALAGQNAGLLSNTRVASYEGAKRSLFPKRLSIFDLAKAKPANPNTCSPQNHAPVMAMTNPPTFSSLQSGSATRTARLYDDGPSITGAISSSAFGKSLRRNGMASNKIMPTAVAKKTCLPQDLYDLLKTTHGTNRDEEQQVAVCSADCLPAPSSFSRGQKRLFAEQYDINWCDSGCLAIADPLPLDDVMKIEGEARVHVCMIPQTRLSSVVSKGLDSSGVNATIRSLFDQLPGGYGNEDNIAVLIGNKNYAGDLDKNAAGHVNAAAMKALLTEQLGYSQKNIIVLKDAKLQDFNRVFGKSGNVRGELYKRLQKNPNAQLMIYYSGHASSSGLGMENYLLPVDAIKGRARKTAYSLDLLYDNLRELDARTTQLFLETGFNANRTLMVLPPNIAERRVNVAPIVPVRGLAIFSAATGDQKSLIDHETGIGLFTRFLIGGLAGKADQQPIGNGDRVIDSVELYVHLANNVRLSARKTLGLRQNPTISRSDNLFLSQLSRKARR